MDFMHKIAIVIGYAFIFAALIGALVPGMNFHVIFGSDGYTIDGHKTMSDRVSARLAKKAEKS